MSYVKKCLSLMLSLVMMFSMTTVSMAAGNNPTSMSIPVTASIDNYYIVSVPASAGLTLTQEYNDVYTSQKDTGATFYGTVLVGVKGIIAADKKLDINFDALTLKADESNTAVVEYAVNQESDFTETDLGVKGTTYDIVEEANKWLYDNVRSTGTQVKVDNFLKSTATLTFNRTTNPVLADNSEWQYSGVLLRTDLPYTGTYTGNLGITFGLSDK